MNQITPEFVTDLRAVLAKHKIEDIYLPDAIGQALEQIDECSLTNCVPWSVGGMLYSYAHRHDALGKMKSLVEKLEERVLNYADLDCTMWAKKVVVAIDCLTCSSTVSRILGTRPTGECPRCHGTRKDPTVTESGWFLVWDNHGRALAYAVWESCLDTELQIRELPENQTEDFHRNVLENLVTEMAKDHYETDYPLLRYRDSRDEGFVLSMTLGRKDHPRHECQSTPKAVYALTCMVEHFPCVLEEELAESSCHP